MPVAMSLPQQNSEDAERLGCRAERARQHKLHLKQVPAAVTKARLDALPRQEARHGRFSSQPLVSFQGRRLCFVLSTEKVESGIGPWNGSKVAQLCHCATAF